MAEWLQDEQGGTSVVALTVTVVFGGREEGVSVGGAARQPSWYEEHTL